MKRLAVNAIRPRGHIQRVPCSISRQEFTDRFIRKMEPAILVGCDYSWLEDNYDLSVASVTKVGRQIICTSLGQRADTKRQSIHSNNIHNTITAGQGQSYHDNSTVWFHGGGGEEVPGWRPPGLSFTLTGTPNDFEQFVTAEYVTASIGLQARPRFINRGYGAGTSGGTRDVSHKKLINGVWKKENPEITSHTYATKTNKKH